MLEASATRAAVLEDKLVATALAEVADSMADIEDFLIEEETCAVCACCCWPARETRLESSMVRGSTTAFDPLNDPFLSKAEEAYLSADDFRTYDDDDAACC